MLSVGLFLLLIDESDSILDYLQELPSGSVCPKMSSLSDRIQRRLNQDAGIRFLYDDHG